jgi:carbon-monoxide dehydrogenase medium subunit
MYPAAFEYHSPANVKEALALLAKYKGNAKLLAGGHSLIPMMKLRLAQPKHLIDIGRLKNLAYIKESGKGIAIGAGTTHWTVESSAVLKKKCPLLPEVAGQIGDVQVRNKGTVGGSLAHADPAADYPAAILALGAELVATGPKGQRKIKAGDFFVDLFTTALRGNEILTEIRIPALPPRTGVAYVKFPHPASRFAIVGVAAVLTMDGNTCKAARVGLTGLNPRAIRLAAVEGALTGKPLDAAALKAAAEKASGEVEPTADLSGSVEYKRHLASVFTRRALEQALARAR